MAETIELRCSKCSERIEHKRRKGVPMGTGAARWRCVECDHIR